MKHDIIYNLLICAQDYTQYSLEQISGNIEILQEDFHEFTAFEKSFPEFENVNPDIVELLDNLTVFFADWDGIERVRTGNVLWISIHDKALVILKKMNVPVIPPDKYSDEYYEE